jgi:hypothetical protein
VLNILEAAEDGPELTQEVAVVVAVVVADDGLDGLGGLVSLVEGDLTAMGLDVTWSIGINWTYGNRW